MRRRVLLVSLAVVVAGMVPLSSQRLSSANLRELRLTSVACAQDLVVEDAPA